MLAPVAADSLDSLVAYLGARHELAWQARAACVDADPAWFFVAPGEAPSAARAICSACPVRLQCLEYALKFGHDDHGVWAGTTPKQRRDAHAREWSATRLLDELQPRRPRARRVVTSRTRVPVVPAPA
jgi:WhiB family redox-sensing transcriptional regulator